MIRFHIALLLLIVCLPWAPSAWVVAADVATDVSDDPLELPKPLRPKRERTETEEDRLTASAWFLRGRLNFQRGDLAQALQCYQRAWRYDPRGVSALREIVPIAFELNRNAEAARYAVIMAEEMPRDAVLLRRLAQHLIDDRDYPRALAMYEKSLAVTKREKPDARDVLAQMEIARLYYLQGQHGKAADAFEVVRDALANPEKYDLSDKVHTALLGNPRVTYSLLGESFLEAGRLEIANEVFEKAYSDKASEPLLAYHLARIEMANDRPALAVSQLEKYFAAGDLSAGEAPYRLLETALGAMHGGDAKKVRQELIKRLAPLAQKDAANAHLAYFLAEKYLAGGEPDKAVPLLENALATEPTLEGHEALIDARLRLGDDEKLLAALGRAVGQARSLANLETAAAKLSGDKPLVERLLALCRKQQADKPQDRDPQTAYAMGLLAIEAGLYDAADEQLTIAAELDAERQPAIVETWGLELFFAEQYDRAAKVFRRAIEEKVAPRFDADFYYYLAAALEFAHETDGAVDAARKAAALKSDSPRYVSRYPWVLYHAKRYVDAEREYRKLLVKLDEDYADADARETAREARMVLSNIAIHLHGMPQAEEWLEQVLDEFPEDIGAMNDLGYLWCDQGKHLERSRAMVQRAVDAEPDNAAYRDSLGWAHFRLGEYDLAIAELEKAAQQLDETPDGVIMDHLGDAYLAAGRKKDALKAFERALELFTADDDQENIAKIKTKLEQQ